MEFLSMSEFCIERERIIYTKADSRERKPLDVDYRPGRSRQKRGTNWEASERVGLAL